MLSSLRGATRIAGAAATASALAFAAYSSVPGAPVAEAEDHESVPIIPPKDHSKQSWWGTFGWAHRIHDEYDTKLPVEKAVVTMAPNVPPPIKRNYSAHLVVDITTETKMIQLTPTRKFEAWTFSGSVPGPFIRAREGDVLEIRYDNKDANGIGHNIDFHAVTGPGGGAPALYADGGQKRRGMFKLLNPGLFIYHCAAAPVPVHIATGMYGLILVEPAGGLPHVDKEFYVLQSEWYTEDDDEKKDLSVMSYAHGLKENAQVVTFNGREGALTEKPLICNQGETVRIFFGNAGPNLSSAFHVIGAIFDKVYRDGDLTSPPGRNIQTILVPPGGSSVLEIKTVVPGNLTLVDHAIFRLDKGCVGFLKVKGDDPRADIYASAEPLNNCPNCKLHN